MTSPLQKARSRWKRRSAPDGPWYDRRQVFVPQELRELKRLYWRVCQRARRHGVSIGRPGSASEIVQDYMATVRAMPRRELVARLPKIRREVRRLEKIVDNKVLPI